MSDITERYDRDAHLYEEHWGSVLAASAVRLLDRVDPVHGPRGGSLRIVDVGTGTGVLAIAAAGRWPTAEIMGVDPSTGMLRLAAERARILGVPGAAGRLAWLPGDADRLPVAGGAADLVVSSFVYQLVPDRDAAFREARRVLRPGGRLAFVTWLDAGDDFGPAIEFDEAIIDVGIEEPDDEDDGRSGDFPSLRAAADALRRAGFRPVSVREETLEHAWTLESYLAFKVAYEERELYGGLDEGTAQALTDRARERLARLPAAAFTWRAPIASAVATRP